VFNKVCGSSCKLKEVDWRMFGLVVVVGRHLPEDVGSFLSKFPDTHNAHVAPEAVYCSPIFEVSY
jgi:hypothetical protein